MRQLLKVLGTAFFCVMSTGALLAQSVKVDFDPNYQFGKLKSYTWGKVQASDPQVEPRITAAVDRVLQGYGYHTTGKNADVIVTAVEATSPDQYATFYQGISNVDWHRGWSSGGFSDADAQLDQVAPGTLIVDLYDAKTGKLVWRGTAAEGVPAKEKKAKDNMDKAVNSMFGKFPPKTKPGAPKQETPRVPPNGTSPS